MKRNLLEGTCIYFRSNTGKKKLIYLRFLSPGIILNYFPFISGFLHTYPHYPQHLLITLCRLSTSFPKLQVRLSHLLTELSTLSTGIIYPQNIFSLFRLFARRSYFFRPFLISLVYFYGFNRYKKIDVPGKNTNFMVRNTTPDSVPARHLNPKEHSPELNSDSNQPRQS